MHLGIVQISITLSWPKPDHNSVFTYLAGYHILMSAAENRVCSYNEMCT